MIFRKLRTTTGETKVEIQMTPMLDMIFQLLIFFILTFKPVTDEGQFAVNMSSLPASSKALPTVVPGMGQSADEQQPEIQYNPPFRVALRSTPDGNLAARGVVLGTRPLLSLGQLDKELRSTVGEYADEYEVIIEADPMLQYKYVVQSVNTISHVGIRKINFATPQPAPPASK